MNNDKDLQKQIDELKLRLDAFNAFQTIPLPVDKAWKNRGFIKHDFFVAGSSSLGSFGEDHIVIPGSNKNSIAMVTTHVGSPAIVEGEISQGYASNTFGASSTQFDITNPAGTTFRYTWDGTGTDPIINATTMPVGSRLVILGTNFNAANQNAASRPFFSVTASGTNFFEIDNPTPGVAENNVTIGSGAITGGAPVDTPWELYVSGTATSEFSFVVFLFDNDDLILTL